MGNPETEKSVFAAFLDAFPLFAAEPVANWIQPKEDPPDILCTTQAGRQIGLELTGWLDQDQMSKKKGREAIQGSILKALHPRRTSRNISRKLG